MSTDTFKPNTRVLAYHGPLIYEAKVLKVHPQDEEYVLVGEDKKVPMSKMSIPQHLHSVTGYFLHYKGWKAKWDEWVPVERVLEYNEANIGLLKQIREEISRKHKLVKQVMNPSSPKRRPNTGTSGTGSTNNGSTNQTNSKKKKTESMTAGKSNLEIGFTIRPNLKYLLIDDWEYITRNRQLLDIPSRKPVSTILNEYMKFKMKEKKSSNDINVIKEYLEGLKIYFNKSLGLVLLYKFERLQYQKLLKENSDFEAINYYGLEHLLRLFVSLPGLISQASMDSVSLGVLGAQTVFLMEYLDHNLSEYVNEYVNVTPDYDRLARGG